MRGIATRTLLLALMLALFGLLIAYQREHTRAERQTKRAGIARQQIEAEREMHRALAHNGAPDAPIIRSHPTSKL